MQRRVALRTLVSAAGGIITLPTWAAGWSQSSLPASRSCFSPGQDALLAEVVDTIIPATDTPGAKALNVPAFIQTMVADCYEPEVQENLASGLNTIDGMARQLYGQAFGACSTEQRIMILTQIEQGEASELKKAYSLIKELTIQGYMTSEYVMTNHTNYQMMPGHYHGCVPVAVK